VFAQVMFFDGESADDQQAGMEHVRDEVIPPLTIADGLANGLWLVNRDTGQRISVLVWESDAARDAGIAAIQAERAKDPDRHRPAPSGVQQFEIYGRI